MGRKLLSLMSLFFLSFAAGCSGNGESATIANIQRDGMVVVGASPFAAPLLYQRGQEWVGPEAELVKRLVGKIAAQAEEGGTSRAIDTIWAGMDYETMVSSLLNKEITLIAAALGITDERKAQMAFSDSYYTSELIMAVNPVMEIDPNNLSGVNIGVRAGTAVETFIGRQFSASTVTPFKTLDDAVLALKRGEIGAVVDDRYILAYSLDTMPGVAYLEVLPEVVGTIDIGLAVRKDDTGLLNLINEVVAEVKAENLYAQWLGEEASAQLERVAQRDDERMEQERLAAMPRLVRIQVSRDENYDFDIYRMANLPFELTEQESGRRYASSAIQFQGSVGSSSVRVPPGTYRLVMEKMNNWSPGSIAVQPSDPDSITLRIRLLRGGQVSIQRS